MEDISSFYGATDTYVWDFDARVDSLKLLAASVGDFIPRTDVQELVGGQACCCLTQHVTRQILYRLNSANLARKTLLVLTDLSKCVP